MRVQIKTKKPIKDKSIKALYVIGFGFRLLDSRMIEPTLRYFADYFGYKIISKEAQNVNR